MSLLSELARKLSDLPKEHVELYQLALRAMAENQDLLDRLNTMREESDRLRQRVRELERRADRESQFIRAEGMLFRIRPDGEGLEEIPYCLACWENDEKLFQMSRPRLHRSPEAGTVYHCSRCRVEKRSIAYGHTHVKKQYADAVRRLAERLAHQD